jgi:putative ABC transport system ATP-binding protein
MAIARALIFEPPLLLADEPTGNLDSRTGDEILNLLDQLHAELNTTILLVTHNEEAIRFCQRLIRLRDGHIISDAGTGEMAHDWRDSGRSPRGNGEPTVCERC